MIRRNSRIVIVIVVGLVLIAAIRFWTGSSEKGQPRWPMHRVAVGSPHRQLMGTFGRVVAVVTDKQQGQECIDSAFEQLALTERLMSRYDPNSQISKINNNAYAGAVVVDEQVFEILKQSLRLSQQTGGAFDITIGPMAQLWKDAQENESAPSQGQIAQARAKVGWGKLLLDDEKRSVTFAVEGMRLDTGAIAKGYGIDMAVEAMIEAGAIGGMVDIGGDIRCFGAPSPGSNNWRIGLQNPAEAKETIASGDESILILKLSTAAVATSGNYRRFVTIDNQKYSHIINPATSGTAEELKSVTVIAGTAAEADGLATAVTVLGIVEGLKLIETLPGVEVILIPNQADAEIIFSSGEKIYSTIEDF